jgi:hypothetical protein
VFFFLLPVSTFSCVKNCQLPTRIEKQKESVENAKKYPNIILEVGQIKPKRKLPQIDITKIEVD